MSSIPSSPADIVRHAAIIAHHLADLARQQGEPEEAARFEQIAADAERGPTELRQPPPGQPDPPLTIKN